jgi:hypothetical protein
MKPFAQAGHDVVARHLDPTWMEIAGRCVYGCPAHLQSVAPLV